MTEKCPVCGTPLEIHSVPDLDGHVFTYAQCPECGLEIGGVDEPVTQKEWKR